MSKDICTCAPLRRLTRRITIIYDHHLQDSEYTKGLDFWKLPPEVDKYVDLWNAVKAAN